MSGATERVAEFVALTRPGSIPEAAVHHAKVAILDTVGVILASSREPVAKIVADYVRSQEARPSALVLGGGFRTTPQEAAFANGVLAHATDFDDMHTGCGGHPSAVLAPVVLALGEHLSATGEEIVTAFVLGFEVIHAVGQEVGMRLLQSGYHPTGAWAALGAVAAAARLLRLDVRQTRMAFGIAASSAAGLVGNFGSMTKPFHAGNGARAGVAAALLAKGGFTAALDIFENPKGYLRVLSPGDQVDPARIAAPLGRTYALSQGTTLKMYPACGKTHSAIDSALHLAREHDVRPEDIEQILCLSSDTTPRDALVHADPRDGSQARFSMEYCVTAAIADRRIVMSSFSDEQVNRPAIRDLMRRFSYVFPEHLRGPEGFLKAETIVIRLKDGRELSHTCSREPGILGSVVDRDKLIEKYRGCTEDILSAEAIDRTQLIIEELEKQPNLSGLWQDLSQTSSEIRQGAKAEAAPLI